MRSTLIAFFIVLGTVARADAHYLWLAIEKGGEYGTAGWYFEEGPRPGDGHYLDPFIKAGKLTLVTLDGKPRDVKLVEVKNEKKNRRWLTAKLPVGGPRLVDGYGKFGVYLYGKTPVLLHYYARVVEVDSADQLQALTEKSQPTLQVIPSLDGNNLTVTVLWKGKPAAGRQVIVRGPRLRKVLRTDKDGRTEIALSGKGQYNLRTNIELNEKGKDGEKEYVKIRHHGTLTLTMPIGK